MAPRSVRLSSPERVLFPDEGITKQDLFEYYRAIAPVLVPHLRNRPFTMKRSPYGVGGDVYFQKQAPKGMPSWIPTRTFRTHPREGGSRLVDFPLVNSPEAVLWMVQMNCIDMNAWYSRVDKPHRPDFVLFDLDPPDGGFALAIRVAHLIREELERLELESYVKTSGADGIHVLVPIARRATYEQTYAFAERVARGLEERHPGLVTTEWLKRKREGVLVDHRQNARGKTIASVYSVRPKPGAPVSTPLRWDELTEDVTPRRFGMREALERVERHGDLFEPVLAGGQALGRALKKLPLARARSGLPGGCRCPRCPLAGCCSSLARPHSTMGEGSRHGRHQDPIDTSSIPRIFEELLARRAELIAAIGVDHPGLAEGRPAAWTMERPRYVALGFRRTDACCLAQAPFPEAGPASSLTQEATSEDGEVVDER